MIRGNALTPHDRCRILEAGFRALILNRTGDGNAKNPTLPAAGARAGDLVRMQDLVRRVGHQGEVRGTLQGVLEPLPREDGRHRRNHAAGAGDRRGRPHLERRLRAAQGPRRGPHQGDPGRPRQGRAVRREPLPGDRLRHPRRAHRGPAPGHRRPPVPLEPRRRRPDGPEHLAGQAPPAEVVRHAATADRQRRPLLASPGPQHQ